MTRDDLVRRLLERASECREGANYYDDTGNPSLAELKREDEALLRAAAAALAATPAAPQHPFGCQCGCSYAAPPADLVAHLHRQRAFSERTFGPGTRTEAVVAHIRKELSEIERDPTDLSEWIDVVLLACDGAWRHGHAPEAIAAMLTAKQAKNEARSWPDWRSAPAGQPIEHDRTADAAPRVPDTPVTRNPAQDLRDAGLLPSPQHTASVPDTPLRRRGSA